MQIPTLDLRSLIHMVLTGGRGSHSEMRVFYQTFANVVATAIFVVLLSHAPRSQAQTTLGWLEWTWLLPHNIKLKTKLDTGAKTSAIDAKEIELFKKDHEDWVRFVVPLRDRPEDSSFDGNVVLERRVERVVAIKRAGQQSAKRYVVHISVCINGQSLTTPVSLADRSLFNYPLLLGRHALRNGFLVDASKTFTTMNDCQNLTSEQ